MLNLSIVIITYNRSQYLANTLARLAQSPFCECPIWVLNNASTDNTLSVCEVWKEALPRFHVVTHRFNIGGNPNIMRAYEYGETYYKWILCDDDELCFEEMGDLCDALKERQYELIRIADVGVGCDERGTCRSLGALLHDGSSGAFYSFGFVPGIIFRSSVVEKQIEMGYWFTHTSYQQLFILMKAFGLQTNVYTSRRPVVLRGPASTGIGIGIYRYWLQSLEALPTVKARRNALRCIFPKRRKLGYGMMTLSMIAGGESNRAMWKAWKQTFRMAPTLRTKWIMLVNLPFSLVPFEAIRIVYPIIRGRPFIDGRKEGVGR